MFEYTIKMRDINKTGEIKNIKLKDEINKFIGLITNNFTWKNKKFFTAFANFPNFSTVPVWII